MRLFVALDIDAAIRKRIAAYMDRLRKLEPSIRWVAPESLHVTLKFIGEFPGEKLPDLECALAAVGGQPFDVTFNGAGFFAPLSPRVFWIGVEAGFELAALAAACDAAVVPLGVKAEDRPFSPHLTLARIGSGRPQGSPRDRDKPRMFELRARVEMESPPEFGAMTAREFFLYESKTAPSGAVYTKLARFAFG